MIYVGCQTVPEDFAADMQARNIVKSYNMQCLYRTKLDNSNLFILYTHCSPFCRSWDLCPPPPPPPTHTHIHTHSSSVCPSQKFKQYFVHFSSSVFRCPPPPPLSLSIYIWGHCWMSNYQHALHIINSPSRNPAVPSCKTLQPADIPQPPASTASAFAWTSLCTDAQTSHVSGDSGGAPQCCWLLCSGRAALPLCARCWNWQQARRKVRLGEANLLSY